MVNNKETGSYYTPYELVNFMCRYLQNNCQNFKKVLEPSAGDGRFLSVLVNFCENIKAIELCEEKVSEIREKYQQKSVKVERYNFLDYAKETEEKYDLIIGNPPYINPKIMLSEDLDKAKEICELEKIASSVMQNMWLAFVVGACRILENDGTIFFVLPMEFMQVQYAEKLREYLEKKFNTIHILSFEEPIFPEIEQDICLVYMANKEKESPYILYEVYHDAKSREPVFRNVIKKNKPLKKWSNAVLSDEEILLLKNKSMEYQSVDKMGVSAPGIVTGGNKYFILTEQKVQEYYCEQYVLPILQKSSYISNNTIILDESIMNELKEKDKPVYLLNLSNVSKNEMPLELWEYLEWAKGQKVGEEKLVDRYKCKNRTPWYGVPIVNKGQVIFFKRYHLIPRVYINRADIYTTDAGYHIRLNTDIDEESLVFCFYNSLTLAQCEFQGRYYGGGVGELVPSEFKELRIPYRKIEKRDVEKLNEMFQKGMEIEKIIRFVNEKTIGCEMNENELEKIEKIRKKLIGRRCKR